MRFSPVAFGACLVGALLFGSANASVSGALLADEPVEEAKEAYVLDESVFDIKDGQNAQYYEEAEAKLRAEMSKFITAVTDAASRMPVFEKANASLRAIYKNVAFCEDAEESKRNQAFSAYSSFLADEGNVDELNKLLLDEKGKETPDDNRVVALENFILLAGLEKAAASGDADALKATGAEALAATLANPGKAGLFRQVAERIAMVDSEVGSALYEEAIAKFEASDNDSLKKLAVALGGKKRFAELVGNDMVVEGVYFEDGEAGEEIKWEDYRGKVVLVDFWATWCGPCVGEIPNVLALYEKYHEAGFDVLGYSLDSDLDALKKFEEERKLPWKTASRKMSMEAEGKDYVNLTDYYGINAIPTMVLVGKDGKVLDTHARGAHLKELLEGLFPDVK